MLLRNGLKFMINQKKITILAKKLELKHQCLESDWCDFSDAYTVVKGDITVDKKTSTVDGFETPNNTAAHATATNAANNNAFGERRFKNIHHLLIVLQSLMA